MGYRSRRTQVELTEDEAVQLAERRWQQLCALEPVTYKRERKLSDFLRRKGLDSDVVRSVLARVAVEDESSDDGPEEDAQSDAGGEFEAAHAQAEKRWRSLCKLEQNDRKRKAKLRTFLMRRRYDSVTIDRVIEQVAA